MIQVSVGNFTMNNRLFACVIPQFGDNNFVYRTIESLMDPLWEGIVRVTLVYTHEASLAIFPDKWLENIRLISSSANASLLSLYDLGVIKCEESFITPLFPGCEISPSIINGKIERLRDNPRLGVAAYNKDVNLDHPTHFFDYGLDFWKQTQKSLPSSYLSLLLLSPVFRSAFLNQKGFFSISSQNGINQSNPWSKISSSGYDIDDRDRNIFIQEKLNQFFLSTYWDEISLAKTFFQELIDLSPDIITNAAYIKKGLFEYIKANNISEPFNFAQKVISILSGQLISEKEFTKNVFGMLYYSSALENFHMGKRFQAANDVVNSVRNQPSMLKNKGILSVFGKSVFDIPYAGPEGIQVRLIKEVEDAIGEPIIKLQKTANGINSQVFFMFTQKHRFILRLENDRDQFEWLNHVLALAKQNGLKVPNIVAKSEKAQNPSEANWLVEELMSGKPFFASQKPWHHVKGVVHDLGIFLGKLHEIKLVDLNPRDDFISFVSPDQWLDPGNSLEKDQKAIIQMNFSKIYDAYQSLCESCGNTPRLCHHDLYPTNILSDGSSLLAVIDWESAAVTNPVWDLSSFYLWYEDETLLDLLLSSYEASKQKENKFLVKQATVYSAARLLFNVDRLDPQYQRGVIELCRRHLLGLQKGTAIGENGNWM